MEAVILIGIQATGKSSFYTERFVDSHLRLNLDMLKTRHREALLLRAVLDAKAPFVVDNTNPTREERERYIHPAKEAGYRVLGYYFSSSIETALERNAQRDEARRVPNVGVRGTHSRLQLPDTSEGFDQLYYVTITADGFHVEDWKNEVR